MGLYIIYIQYHCPEGDSHRAMEWSWSAPTDTWNHSKER